MKHKYVEVLDYDGTESESTSICIYNCLWNLNSF